MGKVNATNDSNGVSLAVSPFPLSPLSLLSLSLYPTVYSVCHSHPFVVTFCQGGSSLAHLGCNSPGYPGCPLFTSLPPLLPLPSARAWFIRRHSLNFLLINKLNVDLDTFCPSRVGEERERVYWLGRQLPRGVSHTKRNKSWKRINNERKERRQQHSTKKIIKKKRIDLFQSVCC